ncbi:MAG: right-handed parallel beta-helix repeat-containing protein [Acidobacteriota bacterium]
MNHLLLQPATRLRFRKEALTLLFCALAAAGFPRGLSAASYYVNNSGSPACRNAPASGSPSTPFCTMTYGLGQLAGGDTLNVAAGTYREDIYISGPAGTASAPTVIRAMAGQTVVILGAGVDSGRVKIDSTSYITLDGFTITNFNQGIHVNSSDHIVVQNNVVHHVGQEGIHAQFNSSFITIQNNTVHDTRQWMYNGEGIYIGSGSTSALDNTNNVLVKNNTIYNTNDEGIEIKSGTHDNIVDGNVLSSVTTDPSWPNTAGGIEIDESSNGNQLWNANPGHIVRNNIIHSAKTGIRPGTGSLVYNNLIYDTASPYYGIYVDNLAGDTYTRRIYHNTLDIPAARALVLSAGAVDARNNIGPATTSNIATSAAYYVNQAAANYHLVAGSAPINAGVNLTAVVPTDIEGTVRTSPDLGAYEYVGSAAPPADTTPPSVPSSLSATATSSSAITLTWTASTDNVGVTGYRIFRNGAQIATSTTNSFVAAGLAAGTQYSFSVTAYDAAGNVSGASATVTASTLAAAGSGSGAAVSAASCSQADVQAAINAATNGAVVSVPAGTCTWSTSVKVPATRGIVLQGAGIDVTTIVSNISSTHTLDISIAGGNAVTQVTGFTWNANGITKSGELAEVSITSTTASEPDSFRIHDNKFTNLRSRGILVWMQGHDISGVIDSNTLTAPANVTVQGIAMEGTGPQDGTPFSRPYTPGTSHAIYIEDNIFNYSYANDGAYDAYTGARYVFRRNTVNGTTIGHHGADSGDGRGIAGFEVYNNTFSSAGVASISRMMFFRSGAGVIFGNTYSTAAGGSYSAGIILTNYRSAASYGIWGACDGTSSWDGNQPNQHGYACLDQIGHFFTPAAGGVNTLNPLYVWGNTFNGNKQDATVDPLSTNLTSFHVLANRDFYNEATGFSGATGVGKGLLSSRPAACTPMTAYFATDTNTLYQCATANTWTSYYTPYTYPHPLRGSGPAAPPAATAPNPPTGLTVTAIN